MANPIASASLALMIPALSIDFANPMLETIVDAIRFDRIASFAQIAEREAQP